MNKSQVDYKQTLMLYQGRRSTIILVLLFISQIALMSGILVLFDLQSKSVSMSVFTLVSRFAILMSVDLQVIVIEDVDAFEMQCDLPHGSPRSSLSKEVCSADNRID